jgi:hypothetical protein
MAAPVARLRLRDAMRGRSFLLEPPLGIDAEP